VSSLNAELIKALRSPDIRERLSGLGMEAVGGTPEQYSSHIKDEVAKYARIVKAAGIKADF